MQYLAKSQNQRGLNLFFMSDAKFMNICSLTIHLKEINVCYEVYVERIICFVELIEGSSSSS